MGYLDITFLGTGTSQGVPVIGCNCEVCRSTHKKDHRLRSSVLLTSDQGTRICIDAGPDFRYQMLREDIDRIDAILVTHSHRDHVGGLDEVRSFNYLQQKPMPIYANKEAAQGIKHEYSYAFEQNQYPGLPQFDLRIITPQDTITVNELTIQLIEVMHYRLPTLAYRLGNFAYITDAKTISDKEKAKLKDLDILVVNALREEEHFSHFNLQEALQLIEQVQPHRAYLTHISHFMGFHDQVNQRLPDNVQLAFDTLQLRAEF
ncbi:MAG: MBL fold metallo-hydrolase [Candidatus Onthomorpha sp.]